MDKNIVDNIGEKHIESYLRKNDLKRSSDEESISITEWINTLLSSKKINSSEFRRSSF